MEQEEQMTDDVIRALPHAIMAEKSVISAMLQFPSEFIPMAVEMGVSADTFYLPAHFTLFPVLVEFLEKGQGIDLASLVQTLLDRGLLERCGGPADVYALYTYAASTGHFAQHVESIKVKWIGRQVIRVGNEYSSAVYDSPDEIPETLESFEKEVMTIREGMTTASEPTTRDSVKTVMALFERQLKGDPSAKGLQTGYEEFDRMTGGLMPAEMTIIGARPSMGKTALLLNIAENISITNGVAGLIFSAEMSRDACVKRLVFSRSRFALSDLSRGYTITDGDTRRIQRSAMDVARSQLIIDDRSSPSISYMIAKARRLKREKGIQFVMVDYLQLCKSNSKQAQSSREREIAEISAGLKGMAKDLSMPVVVLAQLNRGPDQQGTKGKPRKPKMSDLRESGSIEQDADCIGLLHREDYGGDSSEEDKGKAMLILDKNRNGETGIIPLTWIASLMRFETGTPYNDQPAPQEKSRWD